MIAIFHWIVLICCFYNGWNEAVNGWQESVVYALLNTVVYGLFCISWYLVLDRYESYYWLKFKWGDFLQTDSDFFEGTYEDKQWRNKIRAHEEYDNKRRKEWTEYIFKSIENEMGYADWDKDKQFEWYRITSKLTGELQGVNYRRYEKTYEEIQEERWELRSDQKRAKELLFESRQLLLFAIVCTIIWCEYFSVLDTFSAILKNSGGRDPYFYDNHDF